jgi:subtilisin family serine protease
MMRTTRLLAVVWAVLQLVSAPALAQDRIANPPDFVPGEVLLKFKPGTAAEEISRIAGELGAAPTKNRGRLSPRLRTIRGLTVEEAVTTYRNHPAIEYIEPNYILTIDAVPNDPRFSQLWGLRNTGQGGGLPGADIGAVPTWDSVTGSANILICVIDTGLDYLHEDLAANVWTNPAEVAGNGLDDDLNGFIDDIHGYDFLDGNGDPYDQHGHGTHVAGTIAAVGNNGVGVAGVNWRGSIMAARFLGPDGLGTTEDAIAAIEYGVAMGARILNNSWGGTGYSLALEAAIESANQAGVLFVAAAGNAGLSLEMYPIYPASYTNANIVSVGASDRFDSLVREPLWGSNYGPESVDLLAPGLDIFSTLPGDAYGPMSGTSMAAPHVTGALALMLARLPGFDAPAAKDRLLATATVLPQLEGTCLTSGRLDLYAFTGENDLVGPATIADLAVTVVGGDRIDLTWTAVGDDGGVGTAEAYDLRYAEFVFDETNWEQASAIPNPPSPGPPGTTESLRVSGLDFLTTYHFAAVAHDEFGNRGELSNLVSIQTAGAPVLATTSGSLTETLSSGASVDRIIGLINAGAGPLDFRISDPVFVAPPDDGTAPVTSGGPDADRYVWSDSDAAGGPNYSWVDAMPGAALALWGDDEALSDPYPIGFVFPFYGEEFTEFRVSSNGFISFSPLLSGDEAPDNRELPNPGAPGNLVAPYWDDLDLSLGGLVYYRAAVDRLVVQFESVFRAGGGEPNSFQIQLFPNGDVIFLYELVALPANQCTVGIQNAEGSIGLQAAFDTPYLRSGLAVRFRRIPRWIQIAPQAGTIPAGGRMDLTATLLADLLCGREFAAIVPILANDPAAPRLDFPVSLQVQGEADLSIHGENLDFGQLFSGQTASRQLPVINTGCETLFITDIRGGESITADPVTFSLEPGRSRSVSVTFSPLGPEILSEPLIIESNDPDEPQQMATLGGQAFDPPEITVWSGSLFGRLFTGQTVDRFLSIGNTGSSELRLRVDSQVSWWTASPDTVRIPAGETESIPIRLDAAGLCTQSIGGTIHIYSNDPDRPTATLPISLRVIGAADLELPTAALDFGELFVGASVTQPLALFNDGCDTLRIASVIVDHPDFVPGAYGVTLAPGEEKELPIVFRPAEVGVINATITIASDDPDEPIVPVRLTGEGMPAPRIGVRPLAMNAEAVPGQVVERALTVFNSGESELLLRVSVQDTAWVDAIPDEFVIAAGDSVSLAVPMDAAGRCAESMSNQVFLDSNDPHDSRIEVPIGLVVSAAADIHLPVAELDFGAVFLGQTADRVLLIEQPGCLPLTIMEATTSYTEFRIFYEGDTVDPGQSRPLTVSFTPSAEGLLAAILTVRSDDPDEPEILVPISGQGVFPPALEVVSAGLSPSLITGQTASGSLVLRNSGGSDLLFSISTEAIGAPGSISESVDPLVVARGRPVDLDQLTARVTGEQEAVPARISLRDEIINDAEASPTRQVFQGNSLALVAGEEVFGDLSTRFIGDYRSRGNLFRCDTSTTLREHRLYLETPSATQMWFLVYEGMEQTGEYNLVSAADLSPAGPGSGWFSSGQVDVPMTAGRYYLAVASFANVSAYYAQLDIAEYPIPTSFGSLLLAAGYDWSPGTLFPPRDAQFVRDEFGSAVAYYQSLITGQGTSWLDLSIRGGVIAAGDQIDLPAVFDAEGRCEEQYAAEIRVHSNDPLQPVVTLVAELTVQSAADIELPVQSLNFGATYPDTPVQRSLVVENSGCEILTVTSELAGDDVFTLAEGAWEIAPGGTAELESVFLPTGTGVFKGSITLHSNDPDDPWRLVSLLGESRPAPQIRATPSAIADTVAWGELSMRTVTIDNSGGSELEFQIVLAPNLNQISHVDGPATQGLGDILVMETFVGSYLFQQALDNLGLPYTRVTNFGDLGRHVAPPQHWDLIIVSNYGDYPERPVLDDLMAYLSGGGALIYSDWAIQEYYWHALIPRLGAEFQSSLIEPIDFSATDSGYGLFHSPGEPGAQSWTDNQGIVDGQLILPLPGARILATFTGYPDYAAILQNEARNGLLNAFQPANFQADSDGDGKLDMVALCENEILYMTHKLNWLTVDPGTGVIPAGGSLPVTVTFNGAMITGGWLEADLRLLSNAPEYPELRVPVVMGLEGVSPIGDESDLPRVYALGANVPNPFNPVTRISFDLPRAASVRLRIYDVRGALVRTLLNEERKAGQHSVVWNGRDDGDRTLASGVYFYRIETEEFQATRRMVLLK